MYYKYLSEVSSKITKQAYSLYLGSYLDWGSSSPLNFDEFKDNYTKASTYEPVLAFFIDEIFLGYGLIMANNMQHKRIEIGYSVVKKQRRKGYATEMVKHLLSFAEKKYSPNLVCADTFDNGVSEKVLLNNGFKEVGEIPNFNLATGTPRSIKFFCIQINRIK